MICHEGVSGLSRFARLALLNRYSQAFARLLSAGRKSEIGRFVLGLRRQRFVIGGANFGEAVVDVINVLSLIQDIRNAEPTQSTKSRKIHIAVTLPWSSMALHTLFRKTLDGLMTTSQLSTKVRLHSSPPTTASRAPVDKIRFPTSFRELEFLQATRYSARTLAHNDFPQLAIDRYDYGSRHQDLLTQSLIAYPPTHKLVSRLMDFGVPDPRQHRLVLLYENDESWKRTWPGTNDRSARNSLVVENNLRTTDRQAYWPAIERLLAEGFTVIRLGRSNEPVEIQNSSFIDFAFLQPPDLELLELIIPRFAWLSISTGTGSDSVAQMWQVPRLQLNWYSLHKISILRNALVVPRRFLKSNGDPLPWSFIAQFQKRHGVRYDNSFWNQSGIFLGPLRQDDCQAALAEITDILKLGNPILTFSQNQRKWRIQVSVTDVYDQVLGHRPEYRSKAFSSSVPTSLLSDTTGWIWQ